MSEQAYLDLLNYVPCFGTKKTDRTDTGTYSVFGRQLRFDMSQGFPLFTTKYVNFHAIRAELLWFLSGSTNTHDLDAKIWDEWADENGDLGPIYGYQWRSWPGPGATAIDQIAQVQYSLRNDPDSRRHIVSAWNVKQLYGMALAPCHVLFQFNSRAEHDFGSYADTPYRVHDDGTPRRLDLQVYQRSADLVLGVPFNVASYALLLHMMAQTTGHIAGELVWTGGDCHVYTNHLEQVATQIERVPFDLPRLFLNPGVKDIDDFTADDIVLNGYDHHPKITAPVAV